MLELARGYNSGVVLRAETRLLVLVLKHIVGQYPTNLKVNVRTFAEVLEEWIYL